MDRHFDEELQNVKKKLVEMAASVEESITESLDALKNKDLKMAGEIRDLDHRIDKLEILVEDMCIELIARHQPVGRDLRFLIGAIKMNNDLERMGDHSVNIADCIKYVIEAPAIDQITNIWTMAKIVKEMLRDSVQSFIDNDAAKAQKVCERDSVVDAMRNETIRILVTHMLQEPKKIESAIQYMLVAKNLERIADLSTNICEDVVYIAQARVIKHHAENEKA
ncbi:MAG: phosphate signaling complex protein PhoU [candidate division WOR-3 bacterium]|nr:phosphate signaling complex protein PhoU [candidate division WOR-3 bacterium]